MTARIHSIAIVSFFLFSVFATDTYAQKRVALVIGNSDYEQQSLRNPVNDAKDVSQTLRNLGFSVDLKLNANQEGMERAIQEFGKKLQSNSVGLFYFSGHGVQYGGSNYLIPIGAMPRVSAPDHLRYKTVDAGYILGVMKQSGNGLNIVVLDACRNNPFKSFSRNLNRGLVRISGAEGTIIAYSTSPGKVALDGEGRNSPYTTQLIRQMQQPNMPVELMFKHVRKGVKDETAGKQSPWYEASIDGDFYFSEKNNLPITYSQLSKPPTNTAIFHEPTESTYKKGIRIKITDISKDDAYYEGDYDRNLLIGKLATVSNELVKTDEEWWKNRVTLDNPVVGKQGNNKSEFTFYKFKFVVLK